MKTQNSHIGNLLVRHAVPLFNGSTRIILPCYFFRLLSLRKVSLCSQGHAERRSPASGEQPVRGALGSKCFTASKPKG